LNIEKAIDAIKSHPGRPLTEELNAILTQPHLSVPLLLDILDFTKNNYKTLPGDYTGHTFAIFLLATLREEQAFPKIIDLLFTMDEYGQNHVFNDELDEMQNILASTFNGNLSLLKKLVETDSVYQFARYAALEAYVVLWQYNKITREQLITDFKSFLNNKTFQEDDIDMLHWVINTAMLFYPEELLNDIRMAFYFQFDAVLWEDEGRLTAKQFEGDFAEGRDFVLRKYLEPREFHLIEDVEAELSDWGLFSSEIDWVRKLKLNTAEQDIERDFKPELEKKIDQENDEEKLTQKKWFKEMYGNIDGTGLIELQQEYESRSLLCAIESIEEVCCRGSRRKPQKFPD